MILCVLFRFQWVINSTDIFLWTQTSKLCFKIRNILCDLHDLLLFILCGTIIRHQHSAIKTSIRTKGLLATQIRSNTTNLPVFKFSHIKFYVFRKQTVQMFGIKADLSAAPASVLKLQAVTSVQFFSLVPLPLGTIAKDRDVRSDLQLCSCLGNNKVQRRSFCFFEIGSVGTNPCGIGSRLTNSKLLKADCLPSNTQLARQLLHSLPVVENSSSSWLTRR